MREKPHLIEWVPRPRVTTLGKNARLLGCGILVLLDTMHLNVYSEPYPMRGIARWHQGEWPGNPEPATLSPSYVVCPSFAHLLSC